MAGAGQGETGDLGIEDVSSCLRSESGTKSLTPVRRDLYQAMVRLIARYDKSRILRIYKHISVLAYEQSDLYISKIISIIAYAHYQGFLSCSYAKTIRATLAKFHIEVKPNYLHPATFGQPTEKGNLREAYQKAVAFYASL